MYLGEGKIQLERIEEFIKVAKDLEVQEISSSLEFTKNNGKYDLNEKKWETDKDEEIITDFVEEEAETGKPEAELDISLNK